MDYASEERCGVGKNWEHPENPELKCVSIGSTMQEYCIWLSGTCYCEGRQAKNILGEVVRCKGLECKGMHDPKGGVASDDPET